MRHHKLVSGIIAFVLVALAYTIDEASATVDPGPEIGQAIAGYTLKLTQFEDPDDCRKGETKYFQFDVNIDPGARGRFAMTGSSMVRLSLSDGRRITTNGLKLDDTRRTLVFSVKADKSNHKVDIDRMAPNFIRVTVNARVKQSDIVIDPVNTLCVGSFPRAHG